MSIVAVKYGIWGAVPIALLQDQNLTPSAIRVYIALASFQGENAKSFPSLESIAERAGILRSAVPAATDCLAENGWIMKHRHGQGKPNTYVLCLKSEVAEPLEVRDCQTSSSPVKSDCKRSSKRTREKNNLNIAPTLDLVPQEAIAAPSVPKDSSLFQAIKESFLAVTPTFSNWGKEAKAIKTIEERISKQSLDDPLHRAKLILTTFYTLTKTGSEFWRGQPFIPSALASSGIWDRVLVELRRGEEEKAAVNDTSWVE